MAKGASCEEIRSPANLQKPISVIKILHIFLLSLLSIWADESKSNKRHEKKSDKIGRNYLIQILGPIMQQIVINESKKSYEVDPSKCEDPSKAAANYPKLLEKVKLIVDEICSQKNIDKMPPEIRYANFIKTCLKHLDIK